MSLLLVKIFVTGLVVLITSLIVQHDMSSQHTKSIIVFLQTYLPYYYLQEKNWTPWILRRIAQFGALVLITWIQARYLQPLYLALTRRSLPSPISYGRWVIVIMTDRDFIFSNTRTSIRHDSLSVQYAQFLLSRKFYICVVVASSVMDKMDQNPDMNIREILLHGLGPCSRSMIHVCVLPKEDAYHSGEVVLESHLGRMTLNGGIGMLIWCQEEHDHLSSNQGRCIQILRMIIPHMIFRKSGAIIGVVRNNSISLKSKNDKERHKIPSLQDSENLVQLSMNQGSKAFIIQLIRSLHYEYREFGIDCIAVSCRGMNGLDLVVKASFQLLGCEPELDLSRYYKFAVLVDRFYRWLRIS